MIDDNPECDSPSSAAAAHERIKFPSTPISAGPRRPTGPGPNPKHGARLRQAERSQIEWGRIDLDAMLSEDHAARAIWAVIGRLDLSSLYASIRARGEVAGAPAIDPRVLLSLWVFATSEGEGSARELWRLTELHAAYRWLCGGVKVGYHTLSDFRSQHEETLNELITQILGLLMKENLVELNRVAQDGTRIRASAGASSFRKTETLQELMEEARKHLEEVTKENVDGAVMTRRTAARKRGAEDRLKRRHRPPVPLQRLVR